jgi:hypothetical protein
MPTKTHSRYVVHEGEPYGQLPFETGGEKRGEMYADVTPEMAADFLAHSKGGRRIRDEYVTELAREMREGSYSPVVRGKPFKFDAEGYLRDGHHTAFAVIEAQKDYAEPDGTVVPGVSRVPAGVVWGLTEAEVMQVDTNMVVRTYADTLHVARVANAGELAPMVKAALSWEHGYGTDRTHYRGTPAELEAKLREDGALFARAIELARPILTVVGHRGVYSPTALRFHLYLLLKLGAPAEPFLYKWVNALTYDSDQWVVRNVLAPLTDARAAISRTAPFRRYAYQLGLLNEGWNRFSKGNMSHKIALKTLAERIAAKADFPVPRA